MIKFQFENVNYKIWFDEENKNIKCSIFDESGQIYSEGISKCHETDSFNRSFGRKLSLERAISIFDRNTRKEIWKKYFENNRISNIRPHNIFVSLDEKGKICVSKAPKGIRVIVKQKTS